MSPEQIRLYALARIAVPPGSRLRTFGEPTTGGQVLYTVEVKTPYKSGPERHFGVHSETLRNPAVSDAALLHDMRRAVNRARQ